MRGARILAAAVAVWLVAVVTAMLVYRVVDPPFSVLTAIAAVEREPVEQHWVPLERISPNLVHAVIASEDAGFCQHLGISLREIEDAIERAKEGMPRGASTISMQVTKNLFLWPQ